MPWSYYREEETKSMEKDNREPAGAIERVSVEYRSTL